MGLIKRGGGLLNHSGNTLIFYILDPLNIICLKVDLSAVSSDTYSEVSWYDLLAKVF